VTPSPQLERPLVPYNPFHDDAFCDDVVNDILEHRGEWRHPGRIVLEARGGECDATDLAIAVYKSVEAARRVGFVIHGDTIHGYRFVEWRRVRFVRLALVFAWPPADSDERSHRAPPPLPGQMTIAEAVE
jgi:hypothetical protein